MITDSVNDNGKRIYIRRNREPLGRFAAMLLAVIFAVIIPTMISIGNRRAGEKNRADYVVKKYIHEINDRGEISEEIITAVQDELAALQTKYDFELSIDYPTVYLNEKTGRREVLEVCLNNEEIHKIIREGPYTLSKGTAVGIRLIRRK